LLAVSRIGQLAMPSTLGVSWLEGAVRCRSGTKVLLNADFRTLYADLGQGRAGGMAMLPAAIGEEP